MIETWRSIGAEAEAQEDVEEWRVVSEDVDCDADGDWAGDLKELDADVVGHGC